MGDGTPNVSGEDCITLAAEASKTPPPPVTMATAPAMIVAAAPAMIVAATPAFNLRRQRP